MGLRAGRLPRRGSRQAGLKLRAIMSPLHASLPRPAGASPWIGGILRLTR